jgi:archaemetzincin
MDQHDRFALCSHLFMSRRNPTGHSDPTCSHTNLCVEPSPHAAEVGYHRPTLRQRTAAAQSLNVAVKRKREASGDVPSSTFPGPLVLPGDQLALDPGDPPQSLWSWLDEDDRNEVTPKRNVIYVAAPPDVDPAVEFIRGWMEPQSSDEISCPEPPVEGIVDYLGAFYEGMQVKLLPASSIHLTSWDEPNRKRQLKSRGKGRTALNSDSALPTYIGLAASSECTRIRTRPSKDGVFPRQLQLNDLIDAAISMLPKNAYALLLLVSHDLYQDDEDEFVCGLAYGGSRVAVVSTARYHPYLDQLQGVEREHAWPASHCDEYVRTCCAKRPEARKRKMKGRKLRGSDDSYQSGHVSLSHLASTSPMQAAASAHSSSPCNSSIASLSNLWLGRVCRTASHEIGHCFGIGHCMYYACVMQGTASIREDPRQPPYLCPVDLAKVLRATRTDKNQRYRRLLDFCRRYEDDHMFSAYATWIEGVLEQMENKGEVKPGSPELEVILID